MQKSFAQFQSEIATQNTQAQDEIRKQLQAMSAIQRDNAAVTAAAAPAKPRQAAGAPTVAKVEIGVANLFNSRHCPITTLGLDLRSSP